VTFGPSRLGARPYHRPVAAVSVKGSSGLNRLALLGAALDLLLSVALTAILAVAARDETDAVPRQLVLFGLFAAPGVIGLLGALANRRSVLVGAALPLLPGAFLSWAFLTLPFVVPAILMVVGAMSGAPRPSRPISPAGVLTALVLAVLLTGAGVVSLLWLTANTCAQTVAPVGWACSSSAITVEGAAVGGVLILAALAIAVFRCVARPASVTT
jgi:hypothetical protein